MPLIHQVACEHMAYRALVSPPLGGGGPEWGAGGTNRLPVDQARTLDFSSATFSLALSLTSLALSATRADVSLTLAWAVLAADVAVFSTGSRFCSHQARRRARRTAPLSGSRK